MTAGDIRSIPGGWGQVVAGRLKEKDRLELEAFLASAWNAEVYPCRDHVFAAFEATHLDSVRAVLLGQDPYPNAGQACGLAFSVPKSMPPPPSLRKILKTARDDMGIHVSRGSTLDPWTRHGVLLLNTALTVPAKDAGGHRNGHLTVWKPLTKAVLEVLAERKESIEFPPLGSGGQEVGWRGRPRAECSHGPASSIPVLPGRPTQLRVQSPVWREDGPQPLGALGRSVDMVLTAWQRGPTLLWRACFRWIWPLCRGLSLQSDGRLPGLGLRGLSG